MSRRGRPTKLTPETAAMFTTALRRCAFFQTAAYLAEVDPRTVYRWLARGKREKKGPHADFCRTVKKALAETQAEALDLIVAAGKTHWQANAWLLERRYPERWSKHGRQIRELKRHIRDLWKLVRRLPAA